MRLFKIFLIPFLLIVLLSCSRSEQQANWQKLFNEKDLSGWDTYIGPAIDSVTGEQDTIALGLNNDPMKVFSVVEADGQPAIRISGERFGGISTHQEFENYHLRLEFKWGKLKWAPRKNSKRDSGILYHAVGSHGADWGYWMRSQEFQVQEGDCGDYWGVAGGSFDIPATEIDSGVYQYDASAKQLPFRDGSPNGRHCIKNPDAEKPYGEWNVLEVYCSGDTSVHLVNDKVVMVLYNSRQFENGNSLPLTKGKIQFQSEGAEVFYRNIAVADIDRIPADKLK